MNIFTSPKLSYTRRMLVSPGLSVGNKLCFLCLNLPKFFIQLLVYPVIVSSLGMPEMQVSHIFIQS